MAEPQRNTRCSGVDVVHFHQGLRGLGPDRDPETSRADLRGPNRIETTLNLDPGQVLVLGQLALEPELDPFRAGGPQRGREAETARVRPAETALYLIVRAEVDRPS